MSAPELLLTFAEYREPALRLADEAGLELAEVEVHRFPDGEARVRLPAELPDHVALVRSLDRPDPKLVELLLTAETARDLGARRLTLVAPYLCYMRQDVAFHPGEAVSQRIVGRFLAGLFQRVVTVDPHLHRTHDLGQVLPGAEAVTLGASEPMAAFLGERLPGSLLLGPDEESEQWVAGLAARCGLDHAVATKRRHGDREVEVALPDVDFRRRDVVLVDDVASSGRSLAAAAGALHARGAAAVRVLVTHGLFADDALEVLEASGVEAVWCTDSIPHAAAIVPLAPLLASALA